LRTAVDQECKWVGFVLDVVGWLDNESMKLLLLLGVGGIEEDLRERMRAKTSKVLVNLRSV